MAGARPQAITYVAARWGEPTETFVRREASAVARLGAEVQARSLGRPRPTQGSSATRVRHLRWQHVLLGTIGTALRHPACTVRVLACVVRHSSRRNVVVQLWAAAVGLAWASRFPDDRDSHLHAHFGWVAATATWACTQVTGQSWSVVLHAFELHADRYLDGFAAVPLRAAGTVFAISAVDAELASSRWDVPVAVLPMGVSAGWLDDPPAASPAPDTIVSVGSLRPQKGHDVLIRALAETGPAWSLTIVGEGPLRPQLEALAADLGVADRVQLVGFQDEREVRARYDAAWIACLACVVADDGERDGIPVALMEAMARGVPVITSDLGGIPELVEGAGVLVPPGDHVALAGAIERFADADAGARRRVGERGRRRVEQRFTSEAAAHLVLRAATGADEASRPSGSAAP